MGEISDSQEAIRPARKLPPSREAFEIQGSLQDVCAGLVHVELCWPGNQADQWGVATYGYCMGMRSEN
ncbi:MAG TPA: hypothetical protein DHU55_12795 [Blastocatellia bacterium]|jgi:hypothetical protein|nr:hypothetical protein [Blastocatellia bacterium]HAF21490.1 hypothetical protein [Blastocatellia bacterium]HCX30626.1 hypothetical protein [Blastocatellia bacterium]